MRDLWKSAYWVIYGPIYSRWFNTSICLTRLVSLQTLREHPIAAANPEVAPPAWNRMSVEENINFISKAGFVMTQLSSCHAASYEGSMYSVEGRKETSTVLKEGRKHARCWRKEGNTYIKEGRKEERKKGRKKDADWMRSSLTQWIGGDITKLERVIIMFSTI